MKSAISCLIFVVFGGSFVVGTQFSFTDGDYTILERLNANFSVPYITTKNVTKFVDVLFDDGAPVPVVNTSASSANVTYAFLQLDFGPALTNSLYQTFRVGKDETFSLVKMAVLITYDDDLFPKHNKNTDAIYEFTLDKSAFKTNLSFSYACNSEVQFMGTNNCTISMSDVQVQPFNVTNKKFSKDIPCPQDPVVMTTASIPTDMTTASIPTGMTTASIPTGMTTSMDTMTTQIPDMTTEAPDDKFNFTVNHTTCILEEITAVFTLNYISINKIKTTHDIPLPYRASVNESDSHCGNKSNSSMPARLTVYWDNNSFTQEFGVDGTYFYLKRVSLVLNVSCISDFPDNTKLYEMDIQLPDKKTFRTPLKSSLLCNTTQNITLPKQNITLSFSDVKLQPYDITKSNNYSDKFTCAADSTVSRIVPIAVGCALAVLVIIVLIAYLIGRRNSSKHGYESV